MFAKHMLDKGLGSRICQKHTEIKMEKEKKENEKNGQKTWTSISQSGKHKCQINV